LKDDPKEDYNLVKSDPERTKTIMRCLEKYLVMLPKSANLDEDDAIIDPETAESL